MLRMYMYVSEHQTDWDTWLPVLMSAYRASIHETTGFTPNKLMLGRETNTTTELMFSSQLFAQDAVPANQYVKELKEQFETVYEVVRQNVDAHQMRQKRYYDRKVFGTPYKVGQLVWLFTPAKKRGLSPKLQCFWQGPFRVLVKISDLNYQIQHEYSGKKQIVHFNRLKPCLSHGSSLPPEVKVSDPVGLDIDVQLQVSRCTFGIAWKRSFRRAGQRGKFEQ